MAEESRSVLRSRLAVGIISSLITAAVVISAGLMMGARVGVVRASAQAESAVLAAYDVDAGTFRTLTDAEAALEPGEMLVVLNQLGPEGLQGPKGDQGNPGAQGDPGKTGTTGAQGDRGQRGLVGAQGPAGPQGDIGPRGPAGEIGLLGDSGPTGLQIPQDEPDVTQDLDPLLTRLSALETALASAETTIAALEANNALLLGPYITVDPNPINDIAGPNILLTGANLHIRSGSGSTAGTINGLGNLIVGYGENAAPVTHGRGGSHNVVVGSNHSWNSYGGLVAGYANTITGPFASVSGGSSNHATGAYSSVSGGHGSSATGAYSSVSGGFLNTASGSESVVSGGTWNTASGYNSAVSGGGGNAAEADSSTVTGGEFLTASVPWQHLP